MNEADKRRKKVKRHLLNVAIHKYALLLLDILELGYLEEKYPEVYESSDDYSQATDKLIDFKKLLLVTPDYIRIYRDGSTNLYPITTKRMKEIFEKIKR